MPFAPGLLLLPVAVLTFQGQIAARARTDPTADAALDLLATPNFDLAFTERNWDLRLTATTLAAYLNAFDLNRGTPNLTQSLTAAYTRNFRMASITLAETGQLGRTNLRLAGLSGSPVDQANGGMPLPPTSAPGTASGVLKDQTIWYGSATLSLVTTQRPARDLTLRQFVRTSVSSSFGEEVSTYPAQIGTGGGLGMSISLTARDSVSSQVFLERVDIEHSYTQHIAGVSQGWSHAFSGTLTGYVALGLSYYLPDASASKTADTFLPTANLGLMMTRSPFSVSVTLTPIVDQFTGRVDSRIFGQVTYRKKFGSLDWLTTGGVGTSMIPSDAGTFVSASANTVLQETLSEELSVGANIGANYQAAPGAALEAASLILFGGINLSYSPRERRF